MDTILPKGNWIHVKFRHIFYFIFQADIIDKNIKVYNLKITISLVFIAVHIVKCYKQLLYNANVSYMHHHYT